jgi:hypothetical protein
MQDGGYKTRRREVAGKWWWRASGGGEQVVVASKWWLTLVVWLIFEMTEIKLVLSISTNVIGVELIIGTGCRACIFDFSGCRG